MDTKQQSGHGLSVQEDIQDSLKKSQKNKWWLWTCLGCLLLVIVGGIIIFFIGLRLYGQVEQAFTEKRFATREYEKWNESDQAGDGMTDNKYQVANTNKYKVTNTVVLKNDGAGEAKDIEFRMAVAQDHEPFQDVVSEVLSPGNYEYITDEYDNKYAKFDFKYLGAGDRVTIKTIYEIDVNELNFNLAVCDGESVNEFLEEDVFLEVDNPQIQNVSERVVADKENKCREAESVYNFVANNMEYIGYVPEDKGALMAINTKEGDCTDYADLYIAMSRAAFVPSRFVEGVTYVEDETNLGDLKHDWAESYLPGIGWVQVDPTWGRHESTRDEYFAYADGRHIILTQGRNLEVLNDAHYFAYDYYWSGIETVINYEEDWQIELIE